MIPPARLRAMWQVEFEVQRGGISVDLCSSFAQFNRQ
jgi:hypothetical protein